MTDKKRISLLYNISNAPEMRTLSILQREFEKLKPSPDDLKDMRRRADTRLDELIDSEKKELKKFLFK